MNRKHFIQKTLLGTGILIGSKSAIDILKNDIDELVPLDIVGFNHISGTHSKIMNNKVLHKARRAVMQIMDGSIAGILLVFVQIITILKRMHFGVLRVLNDDIVAPGMGFNTHPHDNMEIISIPLEGDLEHKDNMGNVSVIRHGDIQVMSAGKGITHSEFNKNRDKDVKFLQIWLFPNQKNVVPRYDQLTLKLEDRKNKFQQVLSPNPDDPCVWIHQNAWFHLANFDKGISKEYKIKSNGNGLYVFNLNGEITVDDQTLSTRDGLGIWDIDAVSIKANSNAEFLLMEVPMVVK